MRLSGTPDAWRPSGAVIRHRSFDHLGYPVFTAAFAAIGLGAGALGVLHTLRRALSPYPRVDWPAVGLTAIALAIGVACAYFAIDRVLRGWDYAVEVDRAGRAVLALSVHAKPVVIPFDAIQGIAVRRSDTHVTSGRHAGLHRVRMNVVALPAGTTLFTCVGENMVSRDLAASRARDIARDIAASVGVPVSEG